MLLLGKGKFRRVESWKGCVSGKVSRSKSDLIDVRSCLSSAKRVAPRRRPAKKIWGASDSEPPRTHVDGGLGPYSAHLLVGQSRRLPRISGVWSADEGDCAVLRVFSCACCVTLKT